MSSTVSHRERVLRFQALEQLRRSVEQIDNERRSPAQDAAELSARKLDLAQDVSRLDRPRSSV